MRCSRSSRASHQGFTLYLYSTALLIYFAFICLCAHAYLLARWTLNPNLEDLKTNSQTYDNSAMRVWVAEECMRAIAENEPKVEQKATALTRAVVVLILDALLLSISAASTIA